MAISRFLEILPFSLVFEIRFIILICVQAPLIIKSWHWCAHFSYESSFPRFRINRNLISLLCDLLLIQPRLITGISQRAKSVRKRIKFHVERNSDFVSNSRLFHTMSLLCMEKLSNINFDIMIFFWGLGIMTESWLNLVFIDVSCAVREHRPHVLSSSGLILYPWFISRLCERLSIL